MHIRKKKQRKFLHSACITRHTSGSSHTRSSRLSLRRKEERALSHSTPHNFAKARKIQVWINKSNTHFARNWIEKDEGRLSLQSKNGSQGTETFLRSRFSSRLPTNGTNVWRLQNLRAAKQGADFTRGIISHTRNTNETAGAARRLFKRFRTKYVSDFRKTESFTSVAFRHAKEKTSIHTSRLHSFTRCYALALTNPTKEHTLIYFQVCTQPLSIIFRKCPVNTTIYICIDTILQDL